MKGAQNLQLETTLKCNYHQLSPTKQKILFWANVLLTSFKQFVLLLKMLLDCAL